MRQKVDVFYTIDYNCVFYKNKKNGIIILLIIF